MAVWFKQLMAAATDWRTLVILGAGIVAAAVLSNPFPAIIGLGIYLWAVQRLAGSPQLREAAERSRQLNQLSQRFGAMQRLYRELDDQVLRRLLPAAYRTWQSRCMEVQNAATAIYQEWLAHPEEQAEKQAFLNEGLQLATLYMRILRAYHSIYHGQRPLDIQAVQERLARNQQRLEATMDLEARQALQEAIDMDQRVLGRQNDEEAEKERYLAKLAAIESTMDLLRRQVFDPASGGEGERLHEMLLEAEAMDQALTEVQHRTRVRAR
jgi:hypothetical protein